jgi:hypothetical protein
MMLLGCCRRRNCDLISWSGQLNIINFIVVVVPETLLNIKVAVETDMVIVP